MIKLFKYTEYLYLAVALLSIYKIITLWSVDITETYIFMFFAAVSVGMFIFRRNYRKKFENRKNNNQS